MPHQECLLTIASSVRWWLSRLTSYFIANELGLSITACFPPVYPHWDTSYSRLNLIKIEAEQGVPFVKSKSAYLALFTLPCLALDASSFNGTCTRLSLMCVPDTEPF